MTKSTTTNKSYIHMILCKISVSNKETNNLWLTDRTLLYMFSKKNSLLSKKQISREVV